MLFIIYCCTKKFSIKLFDLFQFCMISNKKAPQFLEELSLGLYKILYELNCLK